jgi:LPS-assembly protein
LSNAVVIRKYPELDLSSRDHEVAPGIPVWYSCQANGGLRSRSQLHLVPGFSVDETYYGESQIPTGATNGGAPFQVVSQNFLRSAREMKVDLIAPSFERIFNKKTRFGDKLKHVIEPRITYEYVDGIGSDFNKILRFDPMDLLNNTNRGGCVPSARRLAHKPKPEAECSNGLRTWISP